ncbi:MAG: adenylosuccinate lyase, partial [Promethearchaeota archaeon]
DNIVLEDERDLTNSANERVIFAENFIFLDFSIKELTNNLKGVEFNEKNINKNLNLTKGAILSEKLMLEFVKKGMGRQYAHELLRKINIKARNEELPIREILLENKEITSKFNHIEIDDMLNPENYIGTAISQVENLLKYLKEKYKL